MFKFLKNKLNSWIKRIKKEKVSEEAKVIEIKEKPEEKPKKTQEKREKPEEIEQIKAKEEKPEKEVGEKPKKEELEKAETEEKKEAIEETKEEEEKGAGETKEYKEIEEKKPEKRGFFKAIKAKLTTTKLSEEDFKKQFNELGTELAENNVAIETIDEIKKRLEKVIVEKEIKKQELETKIKEALKQTISSLLIEPFDIIERIKEKSERQEKEPFVIVFFGINGSGKTTTIAKLASLFLKNDLSCVIAASDTFRAASIEQLEMHARKLNVKLIKHDYGADPAAVAFDAIKYAKAKNIKVALIDTAGRMHTSQNLLKEMEKICRVTKPDLRIFVAESITGNDAISQARNFSESVGIDGIILTKADVDEKGGTAVSIGHITGKPILFLGTGQNYSDLEKFDKNKIVRSLGL